MPKTKPRSAMLDEGRSAGAEEAGSAMAFGPEATHEIRAEQTSALLIVIGAQ